MYRIFCFAFAILPAAAAGSASAEERRICFFPGTTQLTPKAYSGIRAAGAELKAEIRAPHLLLRGSADEGASVLDHERTAQILLELLWANVWIGNVKMETDISTGDCPTLSIVADGSLHQTLWHFDRLFFDEGSAEVMSEWTRTMRFMVAGYRPGHTVFRIAGHSDTAASAEASMALSLRRAENVALELVRQGVRLDDIVVEAFGETQLARATSDGVPEAMNRRVIVDVRARPQSPPD